MFTFEQKANSKARVEILSDRKTWIIFDAYFNSDWLAKQQREKLALAGVYLPLVGEWAILSFHELGKEEAKWKRERGEAFKWAQRLQIEACNQSISVYGPYASVTAIALEMSSVKAAFRGFVDENVVIAERARQLLDRAENSKIFDGRRLGANWNCLYLKLLKEYIVLMAGWNETEVMTAITHLVSAAHKVFNRPVPADARVLLQKALRHFEKNPHNRTINYLATALVSNPEELCRNFPRVPLSK
jgi:hypothetical protein